jgi:hypothetical protein
MKQDKEQELYKEFDNYFVNFHTKTLIYESLIYTLVTYWYTAGCKKEPLGALILDDVITLMRLGNGTSGLHVNMTKVFDLTTIDTLDLRTARDLYFSALAKQTLSMCFFGSDDRIADTAKTFMFGDHEARKDFANLSLKEDSIPVVVLDFSGSHPRTILLTMPIAAARNRRKEGKIG